MDSGMVMIFIYFPYINARAAQKLRLDQLVIPQD
jgi:hypothetical protein